MKYIKLADEGTLRQLCDTLKGFFEYTAYINLILYASLMMLILSWNEIIGTNFKTGFNGFSYFFSWIFFLFLLLVTAVPAILLRLKPVTNKIVNGPVTEEIIPENVSFLEKLKLTLTSSVKNTKYGSIYNTVFMSRRVLVAFVLVTFTAKEAQLVLYLFINILYTVYLCLVKPFNHMIHNIVAIINEAILLLCGFMMFAFFADGSQNTDVSTAIIVFFIIEIIVVLVLSGISYELYMVWK